MMALPTVSVLRCLPRVTNVSEASILAGPAPPAPPPPPPPPPSPLVAVPRSARCLHRSAAGPSPSANEQASSRFDLPAPFSPVTQLKPVPMGTVDLARKDLNPES